MPSEPILNIQKGTVGEFALDTLTLLLSCGDLHLARPVPDDVRVDRVLFRPGSPGGKSIQIKSPRYLIRGRYMSLRVRAPPRTKSLDGMFIFAAHQVLSSPWIDDHFHLIPASVLGRPKNGWWRLSLPIDPRRPGKYDPYRHALPELATLLSQTLDGGRPYAFPPSRADLRRLTPPAAGKVLENEAACLITTLSDGALHVWNPMTDTGEDLSVTDDAEAASLRIQVKGSLGPNARRVVSAHIQKRTFRQSRFNLVMILWYDVPALRLASHGWLFRTDELDALGLEVDAEGSYRFEAPDSPSSRSKYRRWFYGVEEIPQVLSTALALLGSDGPEALVPTAREQVEAARARLKVRTLGRRR